MSRSVIAVGPDAPLGEAVRLMVASRISGVPIVDAGSAGPIVLQCDIRTGSVMRASKVRVTPPSASSRVRECP